MTASPLLEMAPGEPNATKSTSRRPDIQGLRAVAVLMVVAFHAGLPVPGGFVGVDVFFVISGFVITGMLARERAQHGRIRLGLFYWRRFKRLTPALALMVSVTIVLSSLALSPLGSQQIAAKTGIGALLLVANYVISSVTGGYFAAPAEANPLLNTWSLSVEEQFYLIFPGMLAIGWLITRHLRIRRTGLVPGILILMVGGVSFGLVLAGSWGWALPGVSIPPSFYSPFGRAWEFAAGALLMLALSRWPVRSHRVTWLFAVVGAVGIAASVFLISVATPFPGPWTLVPVAATLLLLVAGSRPTNPVSRGLSSGPMVRIGDWSYSIYLWHWPFIVLAVAMWPRAALVPLIAVVCSLVPALASYRWLEEPLHRLTSMSRPRAMALVGVTVLPPLALAFSLLIGANHGFWITSAEGLIARSELRLGNAEGCTGVFPNELPSVDDCRFNASASGAPVYLVGDSYGEQAGDAVLGASIAHFRPLIPRTYGGCPFADVYLSQVALAAEGSPGCQQFVEDRLQWLEASPAGLVVIANAEFYFRDPAYAAGPSPSSASIDAASKVESYATGLESVVTRLQRAGHKVLIVQPIPNFRLDSDQESLNRWSGVGDCPMIRVLTGSCAMSAPEPLSAIAARQQPVWTATADVAARTGAGLLDVQSLLCPNGECPVQQGDVVMYREYLHLTVQGVRTLIPAFSRAMESLP
jgi:peptidoglycan/LPS O-acetylase OafA/YrhL